MPIYEITKNKLRPSGCFPFGLDFLRYRKFLYFGGEKKKDTLYKGMANRRFGVRKYKILLCLYRLLQGHPSVDTLYRLIRGIGVSSDRVFYPEISQSDPEFDTLVHMLVTCSPKQKRLVAAFVDMLKSQDYLI